MKKLFFLVLTVLIVACSSDDSNEIIICDVTNASFVGEWDQSNLEVEGTYSLVFNNDETGTSQENEFTPLAFNYVVNDTEITLLYPGEPGTEDEIKVFTYVFETCDEVNLYEAGEPGTEDILYVFTRQ
jgi:hypothetical protein